MMIVGDIIEQIRGLSYSKKDVVSKSIEGYNPVLRAGNIQLGQIIEDNYVYVPNNLIKEKQFLKEGDILIAASSGSLSIVGKAAMVTSNMAATFGAFCKVLRPKQEHVYKGYFKHYFETSYYKRTIKSLAEGANINNLRTGHFDNLEIPLPPIDQQKKIAAILDAADAYRQKTKALITKYEELTQSLFLDMFGDPVRNPMGWIICSFVEIIKDGPNNGLYKPSKDYGSGIPIIRIDSFFNSVIDLTKLKRLRISTNEIDRFSIEEGDFVINRVNSKSHLGKCGLVPKLSEKIVYESNMMRLNFKENMVNNQFMLSILSSKYLKNQILKAAKDSVNQSSINQKDVNSFKAPLPPLKFQNEFADRVQAIETQKTQAHGSLAQAEDLFNSLLQKAFKGELV